MYRHRIISLLIFSTFFYLTSLLSAAGAWLLFSSYSAVAPPFTKRGALLEATDSDAVSDGFAKKRLHEDDEDTDMLDISDTPRTFPTNSRQPPLRYVPAPTRTPGYEQVESSGPALGSHTLAGEADDEDETLHGRHPGGRSDSGIGTSLEESSERAVQRRRNKKVSERQGI